ncbi:MAG: phosphatase PAP2 family protein [Candidatus Nanohaloarchaea archaeon]|nr:phosphatase PAP2 family protein [Candidatus Nanohaloarchaea archaeon]
MSAELALLRSIVVDGPLATAAVQGITALGSFFVLTALAASSYAIGQRRTAVSLGIGLGATAAVVYAAKFVVGRTRPPVAVVETVTPAFPSGHAALAFAAAAVLGDRFPGQRAWFLGLATLVAVSRLVLGVHYPTDVVAGAGIGYGIGWIVVENEHVMRRS